MVQDRTSDNFILTVFFFFIVLSFFFLSSSLFFTFLLLLLFCFFFFSFFRLELNLSNCYLPAVQSFSWLRYNKRVMMETVTIYCHLLLRLFAVYLKTDEAVINHSVVSMVDGATYGCVGVNFFNKFLFVLLIPILHLRLRIDRQKICVCD